jgi:hypothetical protein
MRRVVVESPYKASRIATVDQHLEYLQECLRDCLRRGESPYASHQMLTAALDDLDPSERALGIRAGQVWGEKADAVVCYGDFGLSTGMQLSLNHYEAIGIPVEHRNLDPEVVQRIRDRSPAFLPR